MSAAMDVKRLEAERDLDAEGVGATPDEHSTPADTASAIEMETTSVAGSPAVRHPGALFAQRCTPLTIRLNIPPARDDHNTDAPPSDDANPERVVAMAGLPDGRFALAVRGADADESEDYLCILRGDGSIMSRRTLPHAGRGWICSDEHGGVFVVAGSLERPELRTPGRERRVVVDSVSVLLSIAVPPAVEVDVDPPLYWRQVGTLTWFAPLTSLDARYGRVLATTGSAVHVLDATTGALLYALPNFRSLHTFSFSIKEHYQPRFHAAAFSRRSRDTLIVGASGVGILHVVMAPGVLDGHKTIAATHGEITRRIVRWPNLRYQLSVDARDDVLLLPYDSPQIRHYRGDATDSLLGTIGAEDAVGASAGAPAVDTRATCLCTLPDGRLAVLNAAQRCVQVFVTCSVARWSPALHRQLPAEVRAEMRALLLLAASSRDGTNENVPGAGAGAVVVGVRAGSSTESAGARPGSALASGWRALNNNLLMRIVQTLFEAYFRGSSPPSAEIATDSRSPFIVAPSTKLATPQPGPSPFKFGQSGFSATAAATPARVPATTTASLSSLSSRRVPASFAWDRCTRGVISLQDVIPPQQPVPGPIEGPTSPYQLKDDGVRLIDMAVLPDGRFAILVTHENNHAHDGIALFGSGTRLVGQCEVPYLGRAHITCDENSVLYVCAGTPSCAVTQTRYDRHISSDGYGPASIVVVDTTKTSMTVRSGPYMQHPWLEDQRSIDARYGRLAIIAGCKGGNFVSTIHILDANTGAPLVSFAPFSPPLTARLPAGWKHLTFSYHRAVFSRLERDVIYVSRWDDPNTNTYDDVCADQRATFSGLGMVRLGPLDPARYDPSGGAAALVRTIMKSPVYQESVGFALDSQDNILMLDLVAAVVTQYANSEGAKALGRSGRVCTGVNIPGHTGRSSLCPLPDGRLAVLEGNTQPPRIHLLMTPAVSRWSTSIHKHLPADVRAEMRAVLLLAAVTGDGKNESAMVPWRVLNYDELMLVVQAIFLVHTTSSVAVAATTTAAPTTSGSAAAATQPMPRASAFKFGAAAKTTPNTTPTTTTTTPTATAAAPTTPVFKFGAKAMSPKST